jgi:hypothetical protein
MGSTFVVLGTFYRPAIGELAAIAKAAVYIELPTMGVAILLYRRAGVAALQPEVGPRGGVAGRESECGGRNGQFHVSSFPLTKDVKPAKPPAIYTTPWRSRGGSHFWNVASEPCVGCPITHAARFERPRRCPALRPSAKASTYASGPCQKTISGSTLITAAITRLTSRGTQARQGREPHALS